MKKILWPFILLALFVHSSLFAYDWKADGVEELSHSAQGGKNLAELKDGQGHLFSVLSRPDALNAKQATTIRKIVQELNATPGIRMRSIAFDVLANRMEILATPEEFRCGQRDMLAYLPAGLKFKQTDSLEYGFRIQVNRIFVKMNGLYGTGAGLCDQLNEAIANPHAYARRRNPDFILGQLDKLEQELRRARQLNLYLGRAIMKMHKSGSLSGAEPPDIKIIGRVLQLRETRPQLSAQEITAQLKQDGTEVSSEAVEQILRIFFGAH